MHLLKSLLTNCLFPRGSVRRILRGPLKGCRFIVRDAMGVSFALGIDSFSWTFLQKRIHPGSVVYDIGANRGQMALFFAMQVGKTGHVFSFEPVPRIARDLQRNLELNRLNQVSVVNAAVTERNGKAMFSDCEHSETQGKLAEVEPDNVLGDVSQILVDTVALDDFSQSHQMPDLMKIDVEGAAALLFEGAKGMLTKNKPNVFIELHGPEEQAAVQRELVGRGYELYTLDGTRVFDATTSWNSPLWCIPRATIE